MSTKDKNYTLKIKYAYTFCLMYQSMIWYGSNRFSFFPGRCQSHRWKQVVFQ